MGKCSFMDAAIAVNDRTALTAKRWVLWGATALSGAGQDGPTVG